MWIIILLFYADQIMLLSWLTVLQCVLLLWAKLFYFEFVIKTKINWRELMFHGLSKLWLISVFQHYKHRDILINVSLCAAFIDQYWQCDCGHHGYKYKTHSVQLDHSEQVRERVTMQKASYPNTVMIINASSINNAQGWWMTCESSQ